MTNFTNNYSCGCNRHHGVDVVSGNSIDIKISECQAGELRADILVESARQEDGCSIVRLWGQIRDCAGKPVVNALLKLVKVVCSASGTTYQGIAHTVSDCEGFYQFDLCYCDGKECYKVLVSKAYTGPEQVIETGNGNCSICTEGTNEHGYNPCKKYETMVTPGGPNHKCACPPPCPQSCPQPCPPPYSPCPQPQPPYPQPCPKPPHQPCGSGYQYQTAINIPSSPRY